tara:strand:+ start:5086 stop:5991 length:906 start_codon:yes stop_codon:yes gene_type:complete
VKKIYKDKLKGIFPIVYTFFNSDNTIDEQLMKDQISIIKNMKPNGIACLGLASEVNKLSFKEKKFIIELIRKEINHDLPLAVTIHGKSLSEYKNIINLSKKNNADWIILQPLIKKNTTDNECYNFFEEILKYTFDTITGVQNAKEYLGVGLNTDHILKLYNTFENFRVIKGETTAVHLQKQIKHYPKDLYVFNGRGGQEIIENLQIGCKGIIPATEISDYLIKIYNNIQQNRENKAFKIYKDVLPGILFVMQSIQTLICYGKRVLAYRMRVNNVYDRKPCLEPSDYGIKITKKISNNLGIF